MLNIDFSDLNVKETIRVFDDPSEYAKQLSRIVFNTKKIVKTTANGRSYVKQYDVLNPMAFDTESSSGYLFRTDDGKGIKYSDGHWYSPYVHPFSERFYFKHMVHEIHPFFNEEKESYICPQYRDALKVGLQYLWQYAIKFHYYHETHDRIYVFIGRTPSDLQTFVEALVNRLGQDAPRAKTERLVIHPYVHNFAFDYHYLLNVTCFNHRFSSKYGHNPFDKKTNKKDKKKEATFAREPHRPMRAFADFITANRIVEFEFRDSYVLTQMSLAEWCESYNLPVSKIKLEGGYNRVRTPETVLTDNEIKYASVDVIAMTYGLESYVEEYGSFENTPLTLSGIVRRMLKEELSKNSEWIEACKALALDYASDYESYKILASELFQGGYTHANWRYVSSIFEEQIIDNVVSYDFASSYPYVMTTMYIPYTPFKSIDVSDKKFVDYLMNQDVHRPEYRYWVRAKFKNLRAIKDNHIISIKRVSSKDMVKTQEQIKKEMFSGKKTPKNAREKTRFEKEWDNLHSQWYMLADDRHYTIDNGRLVDNGRIVNTIGDLTLYLTDFDLNLLNMYYRYDEVEYEEIRISEARPFPKELVTFILDKFRDKTMYKGVKGKEALYRVAKIIINCIYGCMVTSETKPVVYISREISGENDPKLNAYDDPSYSPYTEEDLIWSHVQYTEEAFAEEQNLKIKNNNCYLAFQFGVWITANARYNLLSNVAVVDSLVCYCDTDSMKGLDTPEIEEQVKRYNQLVERLEDDVCNYYNLPADAFTPKTPKGSVKRLGIFEKENTEYLGECYHQFKTYGAKRYFGLVIEKGSGKIHIETTVAGIPKRAGTRKIWKNGRGEPSLANINDGEFFHPTESMKNSVSYEGKQPNCIWTDRHGKQYASYQRFGAPILPTSFYMTVPDELEMLIRLNRTPEIYELDTANFTAIPKILR